MATTREHNLAHLKGDERLIGARVLDLSEVAQRDERPVASAFLDPAERTVAAGVLGGLSGLRVREEGGYPEAERRRLLIYPEYLLEELLPEVVRVVRIEAERADTLTHPEVLGAVLGIGLERDRVGDVIAGGHQAQVILSDESAHAVLAQLTHVGRTPVQVAEIDPEQLEVGERRIKEIRTTVASLRLDAVASSGYGTSRTRMVREIKAERVKVNFKPVSNPSQSVDQGDVLSIRGRGRVEVAELGRTTRKGRISLLLRRYY